MRFSIFIATTLMLFMTNCLGEALVTELYDETFDDFIRKNPITLICIYMTGNEPSIVFLSEFAKLAEKAKKDGKPYAFGQLNTYTNEKILFRYMVPSYPTIKVFVSGVLHSYFGNQNVDDLNTYMNKLVLTPTRLLNSVDEVNRVIQQNGSRVSYI
jgi:hypothetical protein